MIPTRKRSSYKVILIGDPRVGKTSIRRTYLGEGFEHNYMITLGADFAVKRIGIDVLQIWDLGGQTIYKNVRRGYYSGADGAIIVFDISRPKTYESINKWIDELSEKISSRIPIILVGNKSDLRDVIDNSISTETALKYSQELMLKMRSTIIYIESSALTGENITEVFDNLVDQIDQSKLMQEGR